MATMEYQLPKGYVALIDEEDFNLVELHTWHVAEHGGKPEACTNITLPDGKKRILSLPRFLMGLIPGDRAVAINMNGDKLDCRRENLKLAEHKHAMARRRVSKPKTSRYRGVSWNKAREMWIVHITANGHHRHIGYFHDEDEAAHAYDEQAKVCFGEFAILNFPIAG